jgi:xylulose-5-phosphate/fructose-6-phosphate phosphoketolase
MNDPRFVFDATVSSAVAASAAPGASASFTPTALRQLNRYWAAANYLTIGQIFLQANPLLRQPLRPEHVKPRLLGHWGTSPGLSLLYAHLNRMIVAHDLNAIYLTGPGHGGPALVANAYLEGTYSEVYPAITRDADGMAKLFRQFSTPGGIPSHVSVQTPGSIHEGGELGYVLSHAFGAAFDNPGLIVAAVVGDGEAETAPLEGAWKSTSFLNPVRDGAVLPVLHLNGYKISGPSVLARLRATDARELLGAHGYDVHEVAGDDPMAVHEALAAALESCLERIHAIQRAARARSARDVAERAHWPAIVLRTPKGWTGPKVLGGLPIEGTFRAHQVPLPQAKTDPAQLAMLEAWMKSYHPETLFDERGTFVADLAELAPRGDRRMSANPHANGGRLRRALDVPPFKDYAVSVPAPARLLRESTHQFGEMLRDTFTRNAAAANFRIYCPDETNSNRLSSVFEVENRCLVGRRLAIDDHISPDGRVMEVLSEHLCEGWLEGYLLTGRHGLFVTYESFAMVSASMTVQHTKWLQEAANLPWRAPVSSLNILLTSTCWRNDHNGFSHQGPGLIDVMLSKRGTVARIYLPPDANSLLSVADHCLRSTGYVNLIVIDKQPQLQWLGIDAACEHTACGASVWDWASTPTDAEPDVVLACAGDTPTLETVAAAWWLKRLAPEVRVRVVNIVDLMALYAPSIHPHGMSDERFVELFTRDRPVIFAFHGYQFAVHQLVHRRPQPARFHVRGFTEQGTTTTPFDMVVLNEMSRFHLASLAIEFSRLPPARIRELAERFKTEIDAAVHYTREHLEDPPEVRDWTWTD